MFIFYEGVGTVGYVGIGILSLISFVVTSFVCNVLLKRKMGEAMMWGVIVLLLIGTCFDGKNLWASVKDMTVYAGKQEVVYAGMAFAFMAYVMQQTGIINRLVNILNALLGRLPGGSGYVATIGCALFGMISGVATASTASIGAVTIPWMIESGWSRERSAAIISGNGGLGNIFPPSSVMLLFLGFESVAKELNAGQLYVGLMGLGALVLAVRLLVVFIFAKQEGLKAIPEDKIMPLGKALRENGSSLVIFLGVIIPIMLTMGPTGEWVKGVLSPVKGAFKSVSLIYYIPILITFFTVLEGWKELPHSVAGIWNLVMGSISKFYDLGALLFFAFCSSRLLTRLHMSEEFTEIFKAMGGLSPIVIILTICVIITAMVGPFNATATTTAMGAVCFTALRSIGLAPVTAAVAFINLVSNQSCVPPNSGSIYIAASIAGVEEPTKIFKDLVLYYAIPEVLIVILVCLKLIPIIGQ